MTFRRRLNKNFFHSVNHPILRQKRVLAGILLHYFIPKRSAAEVCRILVQTYSDDALSETTCRDWFKCFKNNDFDIEDKEHFGAPRQFVNEELEALLQEDSCQTLSEIKESSSISS